jgi:hypothetical protein
MATYEIILSTAEDKALGYVAVDKDQWIQNAIHERCRIAIEQIVSEEVQRLLSLGQTIPPSKEEIVNAAPIKSAAERQAELETRLERN